MDNITSIIESFENGSFLTTYQANLSSTLEVDVKGQLNELLLWLDRDFVPCALSEVTKYDKEQFDQCYVIVRLIKQKFAKIYKFMKGMKHRKQERYNFICNICKQEIASQGANNVNLWYCLQQHDHIEEALSNYSMSENIQLSNDVPEHLNNNNLTNLPDMTADNNGIVNPELHNTMMFKNNTSAANKHELSRIGLVFQNPFKKATICNGCNSKINATNFKFNFSINYFPLIEKELYLRNDFTKQVRDLEGLGMHTIQFKGTQLYTCLICCCDIPSNITIRTVKEHISGQRHTRKKYLRPPVNALIAYHHNWMKYELNYQAHQIHFLPKTTLETLCDLCNKTVLYDYLEKHINDDTHKVQIVNLHSKDKSSLLRLQVSVYTKEEMPLNDQSDDSEETSNGTTPRSNQRIFANMDKAGSDTDDSDTNGSVSEEKKSISEATSSTANEQPPAAKSKQQKIHMIVKSVANPSGTELEDLLERRFIPLLKAFKKLSADIIECQFCKVRLPKVPITVREHILSSGHRIKSYMPHLPYHFYCDICGILFKQNLQWLDHMKQTKHAERCDRLGASRKNKLTEYDCMTCKMIVFGDELSIKRHQVATVRGIRYRKNKEIVLGEVVKEFFKSESYIQEQSKLLMAEANQVLLKQEQLQKCCRALETALTEVYPHCKVYPFGSRVSGLGSEKSDLDIFVDVSGMMYTGKKDQDARSQEKFVISACKVFRKKKEEFKHVNPIPTARTPIVQVYHFPTKLDCDLSFRHGLSVENTKFLRLCIEVQPVTQPLILLLKQWLELCKMHENVTTYALSMMVIFHLQVLGHLIPVQELKQLGSGNITVIDGWGVVDFSTLNIENRIVPYSGSIKQLLREFFSYYSNFAYSTDVICPLLGRPIKKCLFIDKPKGEDLPLEMLAYVQKLISSADSEYFRARSPLCIQDPFDLSHNLTKACTHNLVEKFKTLCDLTFKQLKA